MLENFTREQNLKLLSIIIMSDGSINFRAPGHPHSLRLSTMASSDGQHKMFSVLSKSVFQKKPAVYHRPDNLVSELFSVKAIKELFTLSPTFKTTPSTNQSVSEYLSLDQPTIRFLFRETDEVKWTALRIYFDFDGSVSPFFKLRKKQDIKNGKTYTYYQVQFECEIQIAETNPHMVADLLKLCDCLGLKARIKNDKRNWSGICGIIISHSGSVRKFLSFGPMTDVKISLKSRRFTGVTKKDVAKAVLNFFDSKVPLSRYFNSRDAALRYKDSLIRNFVRTLKSPVV